MSQLPPGSLSRSEFMTKRDVFAIRLMAAIVSDNERMMAIEASVELNDSLAKTGSRKNVDAAAKLAAKSAVRYANALLMELWETER